MGVYVNPENESKREWLDRVAIDISFDDARYHDDFNDVFLVCCFVGLFTALAIAYSEQERDYFLSIADGRMKAYYLAAKEDMPFLVQKTIDAYQGK